MNIYHEFFLRKRQLVYPFTIILKVVEIKIRMYQFHNSIPCQEHFFDRTPTNGCLQFWAVAVQNIDCRCFDKWRERQKICLNEIQNSKFLQTNWASDTEDTNITPPEMISRYLSYISSAFTHIFQHSYFDHLP